MRFFLAVNRGFTPTTTKSPKNTMIDDSICQQPKSPKKN
jgi:hypothetical protein